MNILSRYYLRRYFFAFAAITVMLMSVVYFLELAELFRRASSKPNVTTAMVMTLGAVKLPQTFQVILPFVTLFSAIFVLWRFASQQEITISRAAGLSIWQITMPLLLGVLILGVVDVAVFNPVASKMFGTYRRLEAKYLSNASLLEVSRSGLWLRQSYEDGVAVIHATKISNQPQQGQSAEGLRLKDDVMLLILGPNEEYKARIDADAAELQNGRWVLTNAVLRPLGQPAQNLPVFELPTTLTSSKIEDTLLSPETLSFWALPQFIEALEETGFSTARYQQRYDALLLEPIWLLAMIVIAIIFMQRQTRQAQALLLLTGAILAGVAAFILNNTVQAFGIVEALPTLVAAGAVPFAIIALGAGLLLHLEEGG